MFGLALVLLAVPFGYLLEQVVNKGPFLTVDKAAANHLHYWVLGSAALVMVLKIISFLGFPPWFWFLVGGAALYLFVNGRKRLTFFLLSTTIGSSIINTVVKVLVSRDRPTLASPVATASGKSFPSGHSMSSIVCYGALLLVFMPLVSKRYRLATTIGVATLIFAIGFSRMALGVHFISDVLAGWALGLAWLAASAAAFNIFRAERGRQPVEPLKQGVEPEAKKDLKVTG